MNRVMRNGVTYLLADVAAAVVESAGCTQVKAFVPFTALPSGMRGRQFVIVEVLGVESPEPDEPAAGGSLDDLGAGRHACVADESGMDSTSTESDPPAFALRGR